MTETQILRAVAHVPTAHASKYLQQLCKHFAHKIPATFDEAQGSLAFSLGDCRLTARGGTLELAVSSPDAAALAQLEDVVARHLVRFAFREELAIDWQAA